MRVTVIGCSGSFPGPDSPASCYLVEAEGFKLLLDLGNGAMGSLQRYTDMLDIDAIYLSHLHADHCLDMCVYWVARTYPPAGRLPAIPVYAPDSAPRHLSCAYTPEPNWAMCDTFDFRSLPDGPFEIGPFRLRTSLLNHPVEAYGARIEQGGKTLAYSGDTGISDELVRLATGADLFICEASFLESDENPPDMHLTGKDAGDHAARAGADRLVLTHLLPWHDPGKVLAEAKESDFTGDVSLAKPGLVYDLG
jgi:ribonuclease BN (tRNA processing enzyme)